MAEKEYIEREYVLKCMEDSYKNAGISAEAASKVRKWLYKAPAADVRPVVRGRWISKYPLSTCSVCGKSMILCDFANFCPNCGADMRVGTDMTNADRIRAMSDEELAEWMAYYDNNGSKLGEQLAKKRWLEWLKQEVDG